jgi:hypothetical protein
VRGTFDASQVEDFAVSDGDIEVSPDDDLGGFVKGAGEQVETHLFEHRKKRKCV